MSLVTCFMEYIMIKLFEMEILLSILNKLNVKVHPSNEITGNCIIIGVIIHNIIRSPHLFFLCGFFLFEYMKMICGSCAKPHLHLHSKFKQQEILFLFVFFHLKCDSGSFIYCILGNEPSLLLLIVMPSSVCVTYIPANI